MVLSRGRISPVPGSLVSLLLALLESIVPYTIVRQEYLAPIPESERGDLILAYHPRLNSTDEEVRLKAARAWSKWEYARPLHSPVTQGFIDTSILSVGCRLRSFTSTLLMSLRQRRTIGQSLFFFVQPCQPSSVAHRNPTSAFARIENHYFVNDGFMREGQLLDSQEIDKM